MVSIRVLSLLLALTLAACGAPAPHVNDSLPALESSAPEAKEWPGFGGPAGNFRVHAKGLATRWPESGPAKLWSHPLGPGYAGISVKGDLLYVMSRENAMDVVQARDVASGDVVWEQRYESPAREGHATEFGTGPNATPRIHDDMVFTLSFAGSLRAFNRFHGAPVWDLNLEDDFGAATLDFGFSASPIIHQGRLIVLAGGTEQGALALDPASGDVLWRGSPSSVSYATPIVIDVDGEAQLVYFSADKIIGLDPSDGTRLWDFPVANQYRNNSTAPQWGPDNLLWVATQRDGGTRVLRLTVQADGTHVEELWTSNKISVHFWNTLRLGNVAFASIGSNASILAAIDVTNGEILWRQRGFEQVNFVHAGEMTVMLDAKGELVLARLHAAGIELLSQATISESKTWTAPTLVGTTLYVRDETRLSAFDLSATPRP